MLIPIGIASTMYRCRPIHIQQLQAPCHTGWVMNDRTCLDELLRMNLGSRRRGGIVPDAGDVLNFQFVFSLEHQRNKTVPLIRARKAVRIFIPLRRPGLQSLVVSPRTIQEEDVVFLPEAVL
nr:hypothetical protein CFP56_23848 [Quercus suber]